MKRCVLSLERNNGREDEFRVLLYYIAAIILYDRPDYFFCHYLEKGKLEQVILLGGHVVYIYASFGRVRQSSAVRGCFYRDL